MSDGVFIVGFILFFFAAWLAGGGPNKPISFAGPFITPITTYNTEQVGYGDQIGPLSIGSAQNSLFSIQQAVTGLKQDVQGAKLYGEVSPYRGKVEISWGHNISATDANQEYITIRATNEAKGGVTISGWRLVSASNDRSGRIPQGQELLSRSSSATSPIILYPNQVAIITSGESPVDVSFRENKCTGYQTQSKTFTPSLSQSCPLPIDDFDTYYSGNIYKDGNCTDFVKTVNRCQVPKEDRRLSASCYTFIDTYLNYNGCVATHRGDADFWGGAWRIYLGRTPIWGSRTEKSTYGELWTERRDAIKLLDENGKTVDVYEY